MQSPSDHLRLVYTPIADRGLKIEESHSFFHAPISNLQQWPTLTTRLGNLPIRHPSRQLKGRLVLPRCARRRSWALLVACEACAARMQKILVFGTNFAAFCARWYVCDWLDGEDVVGSLNAREPDWADSKRTEMLGFWEIGRVLMAG